jgi:hypothetical protein
MPQTDRSAAGRSAWPVGRRNVAEAEEQQAVTVDFDTTRAPLGAADLERLVRAVSRAEPTDETVWLEWKGQSDLSSPAGKVSVARFVLGFANRLPAVASQFCEGRGYMVVGAEPGQVRGLEPVDAATLEPWVNAYLGDDGPRWTPHWVSVDGIRVLVVEVAAPRQGDPVYCLAKDYDRYRNGDVFIRRHGATERASASEVRALVERAKGGAPMLRTATCRAVTSSGSVKTARVPRGPPPCTTAASSEPAGAVVTAAPAVKGPMTTADSATAEARRRRSGETTTSAASAAPPVADSPSTSRAPPSGAARANGPSGWL